MSVNRYDINSTKYINSSDNVKNTNNIETEEYFNIFEDNDNNQAINENHSDLTNLDKDSFNIIYKELENEIKRKKQELDDEKSTRGWATSLWNGVKELFGGGDNQKAAEIAQLESQLTALKSNTSNIKEVYKNITGNELDISRFNTIKEVSNISDNINPDLRKEIITSLENQCSEIERQMATAKNSNGWISGTWDAFKNWTGIGASSNKADKQIENMKNQIAQLNNHPEKLSNVYKNITGKDLTEEELNKFISGDTSLINESKAGEDVSKYSEGQKMSTDVAADIVSGIIAVGAVAAAPFTGGASIAFAAGVGAAVKIGMKATDCIGNEKKYGLKDLGYDVITGAINGAMGPISNGAGGAVGTATMKAFGMETLENTVKGTAKVVGKKAVEETTKLTAKQVAVKGIATVADMAVDGALSGATDGFARALAEGRIEDIPEDMANGAIGGAIASPLIGGGFKAAGAIGKKISNNFSDTISREVADNMADEISDTSARETSGTVKNKKSIFSFMRKESSKIKYEVTPELQEQINLSSKQLYSEAKTNIKEAGDQIGKVFDISGNESGDIGIMTARAKGEESIQAKLINKAQDGKIKTAEFQLAKSKVGDLYGTRLQMTSLNTKQVENILSNHNLTYEEFVNKYIMKKRLKPNQLKIRNEILNELKEAHSQKAVEKLVNAIKKGQIQISEINNYGDELTSYLTPKQIKQLIDACQSEGSKSKLEKIVTKTSLNDFSNNTAIDDEILKITTSDGSTKLSGYASTQMNILHLFTSGEYGLGEFQLRGTAVNSFADVEHIPYDIRKAKIKLSDLQNPNCKYSDPSYVEAYNLITSMSNKSYKKYNKYLESVYEYLRLQELGINVPEPKLGNGHTKFYSNSTIPKDITQEVDKILSAENLLKISQNVHNLEKEIEKRIK